MTDFPSWWVTVENDTVKLCLRGPSGECSMSMTAESAHDLASLLKTAADLVDDLHEAKP